MLLKTWKCNCFYTHNIYINEYNVHLVFKNEQQFIDDYHRQLHKLGCDTDEKYCRLLDAVKDEVKRRKSSNTKIEEITVEILANYVHLNADIYDIKESYFEEKFIEFVQYCKNSNNFDSNSSNRPTCINQHSVVEYLYSIPMFNREFCKLFISEIKHFQESDFPKTQPNTMNKYGVMLNQIGFSDFMDKFVVDMLMPITALLYNEYGGASIDSYKAFIVAYKTGEDIELSCHYDNAEVSLNVSLNDDFSGGNLYVSGMRSDRSRDIACSEVPQVYGTGIFHRGQQMHGALPITSGERFNLIIWLRSSTVRNELCPMCDQVPSLVDPSDNGDGFTEAKVKLTDICVVY